MNRRIRKSLISLFVGVLCLSLWLVTALPLLAQTPPLTAEVDRTTVSSDDTITLSVTVSDANASRPELPLLDGFQVVGSSTASQISIVNGSMSTQATYRYVLRPTRAGDLQIPPISVLINDQTISTAPIPIQVTQGAAQQPASPNDSDQVIPAPSQLNGQDVFVEADVDNPTPYLGEQIVYTFRLYQAIDLFQQPQYEGPDYAGFWNRDETQQKQYATQAGGRNYQVTELQTILFPTVLGEQVLDPARLTIPGSFFSSGTTLQTNPVRVDVQPLPPDAPDTFNGAVGQFELSAEVDTTDTIANEPVTLRLTIQGFGNLETLPDPNLPEFDGWRTFESTSTTNTQILNDRVGGSRVYEHILVPTTDGSAIIPPVTYTYFDPETISYQTATSDPIVVNVAPGIASDPIPPVPGVAQETVIQLDSDIRHIKPAPANLEPASRALFRTPGFWIIVALPLLLIAGDVGWQWARQRQGADPTSVRRSRAQKQARRKLVRARKGQTDPHVATADALTSYLSDKLDQPVAGMTQSALASSLQQHGVQDELVVEVTQLLSLSEGGRYAPTAMNGQNPAQLLKETEQVIKKLEKVL